MECQKSHPSGSMAPRTLADRPLCSKEVGPKKVYLDNPKDPFPQVQCFQLAFQSTIQTSVHSQGLPDVPQKPKTGKQRNTQRKKEFGVNKCCKKTISKEKNTNTIMGIFNGTRTNPDKNIK